MQTFRIDYLGPFPSTAKNYQYLLVVMDAFTKFVWLVAVRDTSCAAVFKRQDCMKDTFGSTRRTISDRSAAFTAKDFEQYCFNEKIEHKLITTGVPRGNGQVERMNGAHKNGGHRPTEVVSSRELTATVPEQHRFVNDKKYSVPAIFWR